MSALREKIDEMKAAGEHFNPTVAALMRGLDVARAQRDEAERVSHAEVCTETGNCERHLADEAKRLDDAIVVAMEEP